MKNANVDAAARHKTCDGGNGRRQCEDVCEKTHDREYDARSRRPENEQKSCYAAAAQRLAQCMTDCASQYPPYSR
jgi:hypothetical protein